MENYVLTIETQIPDGFEIDEENSTLKKIILKKKIEVKTETKRTYKWEDFDKVEGWFVSENSSVVKTIQEANDRSKNVWRTEEYARASLALNELLWHRDRWRNGWIPNYNCGNCENKYCILSINDKISVEHSMNAATILTFKDNDMASDFLETFKNLINIAKPLLF